MPKNQKLNSVLIIGSGPIVIGQACEFDYSGSQSLRSLREDGIETILINSNPATIMTDPSMADHVYLLPLTTKSIIQILKEHPQIDAVLPTMGGQTALNLCIEADDKGIWKDFGVDLIGVDIDAINVTEDREQFRELMIKIDVPMAPQATATSFLKGKEIAQEFGFPLVIRASYTLGGAGASFVYKEEDFDEYYNKVCAKPDGIVEWSILLDRIMVQETRFYRNPESLALFSNYLENISSHKETKAINIWSVGCSSGEEPYTLAILCQEILNTLQSSRSYGITATDISLPVLAKAREGLYNARKLLDLKSELIDSYFEALDGNKFKIKSPLKNKVCFSMANMIDIEKSPLRNMDVIYCQNVLIYFRKERKHIILNSLVERLAPGGLLIIGQGEALDWHNSLVSRVPDNQTLAYIRQTTQEH